MKRSGIALLAGAIFAIASPGQPGAEGPTGSLALEEARGIAAVASAEARKNRAGGAIAIVDDGGYVLYVERLDGTFAAAGNISIGKARTSAIFKKPTSVFEDAINEGRTAMAALADFTPLRGGVPIERDGVVIGAIGVSGAASAAHDEEIARAAAASIGTRTASVARAPQRTLAEPTAMKRRFPCRAGLSSRSLRSC